MLAFNLQISIIRTLVYKRSKILNYRAVVSKISGDKLQSTVVCTSALRFSRLQTLQTLLTRLCGIHQPNRVLMCIIKQQRLRSPR